MTGAVTLLRHYRVELALRQLRHGNGRPLLLLHGLGQATPSNLPERYGIWRGPVFGLDFTGHGGSTIPTGGGYSAETLLGDADHAVGHLGRCTVVGEGLGGYIAVLLAGGRPELVRGAIVCDGPGISGGAVDLATNVVVEVAGTTQARPDPWALWELARDPRPVDYVIPYVRQAVIRSGLDCPVWISARVRPPWLRAVCADPAVVVGTLADGLQRFAAVDQALPPSG